MPKVQPARTLWQTEDRALDWERWRFLETMDEEAPEVWQDLVQGDRNVSSWGRRHNLDCPWVVEYAGQRLRRVEAWELRGDGRPLGYRDHWETCWCPLLTARPTPLPFNDSPPSYDPRVVPRNGYLRMVKGYIARQEAAAASTGAAPHAGATQRDLRRLVQWQVLRRSPESIARHERTGARSRRAGDNAEKNLAEDVRERVKRLAGRLGMPERPRGRPGAPRLSGIPG